MMQGWLRYPSLHMFSFQYSRRISRYSLQMLSVDFLGVGENVSLLWPCGGWPHEHTNLEVRDRISLVILTSPQVSQVEPFLAFIHEQLSRQNGNRRRNRPCGRRGGSGLQTFTPPFGCRVIGEPLVRLPTLADRFKSGNFVLICIGVFFTFRHL